MGRNISLCVLNSGSSIVGKVLLLEQPTTTYTIGNTYICRYWLSLKDVHGLIMTWVTDSVQQGLVALTRPGHPGCLWGHRAVPSTTRDCPVGPSKGTSPGMMTGVNPEPCGCSAWPQCQGRAEVQPGTQVLKSGSVRCTSTCSHTYSNRAGKDKERGHELKCSSEERETPAETSPSSSCPSSFPAMWSQVTQPSHSKAVLR